MTTAEMLRARIENKPGLLGATITLRSGGYFDFIDPQPDMIRIADIAWGLSLTCRFAGQCLQFYSVAQHSMLVAELAPEEDRFAALMHDAAEAYVGDMVGPLKQLCPDYKVIEKRVEAAIAERFGLPQPMPPSIKHADLRALRTEQRDITSGSGDNWSGLDAYEPLPARIVSWSPNVAHVGFLAAYEHLRHG